MNSCALVFLWAVGLGAAGPPLTGTVEASRTERNASGFLFTVHTVRTASGTAVEFRQPGGIDREQGVGLAIGGQPLWRVGDRLAIGRDAGGALQAVALHAGGQPLHWKDGRLLLAFSATVHLAGAPTGVDPREEVDSVHAALAAAARQWAAAPYAAIAIETGVTPEQAVAAGGPNLVTFTDPAPFDGGLCDKRSAAACTLLSFIVETGEIQYAGIAFNPYFRFSSIGLPQTVDIGAVMLHETGHALGLDHSALLSSSMSPFVETLTSSALPAFALRELSGDDLLSLAELYPAPDAASRLGRLEGTARLDGNPLSGGHVIAVRADGTPARDTLSDTAGRYAMALEPGAYTLLLEPLDGPVTAARFTQAPPQPSPPFPTVFWTAAGGHSLDRDSVTIDAAGTALADFAVASGQVSNLQRVGFVEPDKTSYLYQVALSRGADYRLSLIRDPLTGTPALSFSSPALQLNGPTIIGPDPDLVEQAITIPPDAPLGSFNLYFHNGTSGAVLAGALRVTLRPSVASVQASADGQEILITGTDLAASELSGEGATQVGGISVRLGDRFAPLVSVSPSQIRARVPAGLTGDTADLTVLAGPNSRSVPVALKLAAK